MLKHVKHNWDGKRLSLIEEHLLSYVSLILFVLDLYFKVQNEARLVQNCCKIVWSFFIITAVKWYFWILLGFFCCGAKEKPSEFNWLQLQVNHNSLYWPILFLFCALFIQRSVFFAQREGVKQSPTQRNVAFICIGFFSLTMTS